MSLHVEVVVLSVGWEARIRCILFWHRILTNRQYHHHLIQRLAYASLMAPVRGQWVGKLKTCFDAFGWQDYSCATLAVVSGGHLREMLRSVAWRMTASLVIEDRP